MSTREFAAQALAIVLPFLLTLITLAIGFATNWARTHFKISAQNTAVDAVFEAAVTAVSNAMQRLVADLKDPSKPGTWDAVAAASIKKSVVQDVHTLGAQALDRLKASNWTDAQRATLVEQLVERAVLEVRARTATPVLTNGHAS
jgi:hypothetical protein